jgi:hypothetical protein
MYKIGAFLGGKLMAVYPNEYKYYEELYQYAINLSKESGVFIEVRYFDADAYTEIMEMLKHVSTRASEIIKMEKIYE